jgi:hypothetical protein
MAASIFSSTLKMEAAFTSETLVNTSNITRRRDAEDQHLNLHRREYFNYEIKVITILVIISV